MPRSRLGLPALALFVAATLQAATDSALAQCTPRWSAAAFNSGGFSGTPYDAIMFDDGGGPALYVSGPAAIGGVVTSTGVLRYDGHAWSALPSYGCTGGVGSLVVFDDDGPGPIPPAIYTTGCP